MNNIKFEDMVAALAKPGDKIIASLTPDKVELMHYAVGVSSEAFELRVGMLKGNAANVLEEAGDMLFFLQGACIVCGFVGMEYRYDSDPLLHSEKELANRNFNECNFMDALDRFASHIKKHVMYEVELDYVVMDDAVHDITVDLAAALWNFGYTFADAFAHNKAKLAARYENFQFTNEAAIQRKDKAQ